MFGLLYSPLSSIGINQMHPILREKISIVNATILVMCLDLGSGMINLIFLP